MDAELQSDLLYQSNLLPSSRKNFLDGSISVIGAPTVLRNVPAVNPSVILFHPFSHEVIIAGQTQVSASSFSFAHFNKSTNFHFELKQINGSLYSTIIIS